MPNHRRRHRRPLSTGILLAALLLLPTLLVAPPAAAQGGFSLGPRASTAGLGAELSVPLGSSVTGRLALGTGSLGFEVDSDDVTYDGDVDLSNALALLDVHPGRGSFRISVGALVNDNRFEGSAPIRDLLLDEGIPVPPGFDLGRVRATAEVEPLAPYLGIGWSPHPDGFRTGGWHGSFDLGVAWHGEPDVRLDVLSPIPVNLIPGGQALLDQVLEEERQALEDEVRDYTFFPVVALSIGYRF